MFVDNERSITVSSSDLIQALPAPLRLALQQQQQQQDAAVISPRASSAESGPPVSVAAAAAAIQTVRKLIKHGSTRSRDRGSSGGGVTASGGARPLGTRVSDPGIRLNGGRATGALSEPLLSRDSQV